MDRTSSCRIARQGPPCTFYRTRLRRRPRPDPADPARNGEVPSEFSCGVRSYRRKRRRLLHRLEPQRAAVIDRDLVTRFDRGRCYQIEGLPSVIAIHPGTGAARVVAQSDETEPKGAAP